MNPVFSKSIEEWYRLNGRDLPWRHTQDPYAVWVSEIILQQTRVAQGMDYFNRFLSRFPTVEELAAASEEEVLLMWQGLGYYSRARNLHKAAKQIVAMGGFPKTFEEVMKLSGVGEYTAAAICSFCFGLPCAVLDGNVFRVLSRYFGIDTPIDTPLGKRTFRSMADEMLDTLQPALYNQSIMDFGAMVCTPKSPQCADCPLAETCVAFTCGNVTLLPVKSRKTKVRNRYLTYLLLTDEKDRIYRKDVAKATSGRGYTNPSAMSRMHRSQPQRRQP